MRDRVLLALGAGAVGLALLGPAVGAAFSDSGTLGWGGFGHMSDYAVMHDGGHMTSWWGDSTAPSSSRIEGAAEVTVTADEFRFEPTELVVTAGDPVNLTLINRGATTHDFVIPGLGVRIVVAPGEEATVGFVPSSPGEYPVFCSFPGHAAAGMEGIVTVEETT